MMGEDDTDDMSEGSFNSKSVWARISVIAAGPVFNLILAWIFCVILVGATGYLSTSDHLAQMLNDNRDYIERFCHPENLTIGKDVEAPKLAMSGILTGAEVYIPMAELVDLDEERDRMEKEIAKLEKEVERSQKKLGNEKFVNNAPEKVVEAERQKATEWQQKLAAAKERLQSLQQA